MKTPYEYWASGDGLTNVTPPSNGNPESAQFFEILTRKLFLQSVVEFGCGTGRLAKYFDPNLYLGVDICSAAVKYARFSNPLHKFKTLVSATEVVTSPNAIFAHTVMLHIPDESLEMTCCNFDAPMVVISEVLGRNWRRDGNPPVFNREINDYDRAMKFAGYKLQRVEHAPYPHYKDTDLAVMEFHRIA